MNKKIYRSRTKKMVSGVCGGLEDYLGIDVTIIRLVWIIFSLVSGTFPGLIAYIIAAAIVPEEPANNDNWTGNNDNPWNSNDSWSNPNNQNSSNNQGAPQNQPYESPYSSSNSEDTKDDTK